MTSRKLGIGIVLLCCLAVAYLAGRNTALNEEVQQQSITITEPAASIAPQTLAPSATAKPQKNCDVIGNKNSGIYHVPGCASYSRVREYNREYFCSEEEAEKAGYRKARNCH